MAAAAGEGVVGTTTLALVLHRFRDAQNQHEDATADSRDLVVDHSSHRLRDGHPLAELEVQVVDVAVVDVDLGEPHHDSLRFRRIHGQLGIGARESHC